MIHGRNLIVSIDGLAIAGATSCELSVAQEFIKACSPTDSRTFKKIPTIYDWSISVDCLVPTSYLSGSLIDKLTRGTEVLLTFTDGSSNIRAGFAYVMRCNESGPVGGLAKFSASFDGNGTLYIGPTSESLTVWDGHTGGFSINSSTGNLDFNNSNQYKIYGTEVSVNDGGKLLTSYSGLLAIYDLSYSSVKNAITNNNTTLLNNKLIAYADGEEMWTDLYFGAYTIIVNANYNQTPSVNVKLLSNP